eukprot:UN34432
MHPAHKVTVKRENLRREHRKKKVSFSVGWGWFKVKGSYNQSKSYSKDEMETISNHRAKNKVRRLSWASCISSIKRSGDIMSSLLNASRNTNWVLQDEEPFSLTTNRGFHFYVDSVLLMKNLAFYDSSGSSSYHQRLKDSNSSKSKSRSGQVGGSGAFSMFTGGGSAGGSSSS